MIEALVYIGVVVVLLAAAYLAMDRCLNNSLALRRSADDFARVLHVGERWRADVRGAKAVSWEQEAGERILSLRGGQMPVAYRVADTNLLRRVGSGPWVPILCNFRELSLQTEARERLTAWRCEVEMAPRSRHPRFRPIFTFIAVPAAGTAP